MNLLLILSILVSFLASLFVLPIWIKKCKKVGLLWEDMNKFSHPKDVAASGGIIVIMSFLLGVLVYIAFRTFWTKEGIEIPFQIFTSLSVILILGLVGLTDDFLGWYHGGLSPRVRILLAVVASIPLVVINAGDKIFNIPFLGPVNIGLLYPLLFIPIGITGATTVYNFLAGFNGLETGQGMIILSFLSFIAYKTGNAWLGVVGLCMVAALAAFYLYNKVPARVFPGDILTYSVGALIAIMAILGNFERIAVFVFIPYILEFILKVRGRLKKQSFGIPQEDGTLKMPYDKFYGLTHISMYLLKRFKIKVTEDNVTYLIFSFQIIICLLALIIFREALV